MRIALGAGAALCLVVGLPAAAELSNRSVRGYNRKSQTEQPRGRCLPGLTVEEVSLRGKSGHQRARVVGSADPGKPEGKCHRNDTA